MDFVVRRHGILQTIFVGSCPFHTEFNGSKIGFFFGEYHFLTGPQRSRLSCVLLWNKITDEHFVMKLRAD